VESAVHLVVATHSLVRSLLLLVAVKAETHNRLAQMVVQVVAVVTNCNQIQPLQEALRHLDKVTLAVLVILAINYHQAEAVAVKSELAVMV